MIGLYDRALLIPKTIRARIKSLATPMQITQFWEACLRQFQDELSPQQFNTWIRPLQVKADASSLTLLAPNRFVQNWIRERFLARIEAEDNEAYGVDRSPPRQNRGGVPSFRRVTAATNRTAAGARFPGQTLSRDARLLDFVRAIRADHMRNTSADRNRSSHPFP